MGVELRANSTLKEINTETESIWETHKTGKIMMLYQVKGNGKVSGRYKVTGNTKVHNYDWQMKCHCIINIECCSAFSNGVEGLQVRQSSDQCMQIVIKEQ